MFKKWLQINCRKGPYKICKFLWHLAVENVALTIFYEKMILGGGKDATW